MSEPPERSGYQLAAALRARAGLAAGSPSPEGGRRRPVPVWALPVAAVLLGAVAGVLAGLISLL